MLVSFPSPAVLADPGVLAEKEQTLFSVLRSLRKVIVAYSGGTDSAYLAWAAHQALSESAIAITADSASIPESHKRDAEQFARDCGFRHEYIVTHEFENPEYVKNDANRCFHCKDELFDRLEHQTTRLNGTSFAADFNAMRKVAEAAGDAASATRLDMERAARAIADQPQPPRPTRQAAAHANGPARREPRAA